MKMSHGMVGYAKWVNFEYLYLLNVLAFRSKKSHSKHYMGKYVWKSNQKGCCQKWIEFKWIYPEDISNVMFSNVFFIFYIYFTPYKHAQTNKLQTHTKNNSISSAQSYMLTPLSLVPDHTTNPSPWTPRQT